MNLYLWCKDTQKYSDCGIRKYKKNKTGGISGFIINYGELPVLRLMNLSHRLW